MKNRQLFTTRFLLLAIIFVVCLITSNFYVQRMFQFGNLPVQFSGAVLLFPISYVINDCLTEVYGYKRAMLVIWFGFALSLVFAGISALLCIMPLPMDSEGRQLAEAFDSLFSLVPRITAGSLLAFLVGSSFNSFILSKLKLASGGRHFSLRALVSTVGGELVDSAIFFPVAFMGVLSSKAMLALMFGELILKIGFELVLLPLKTLFVRKLKRVEEIDTFDNNISYNPFKIL